MELLLAVAIAAILLWSLQRGRVPTGWRMVYRAKHPVWFRATVLSYASLALAMLAIFAAGL